MRVVSDDVFHRAVRTVRLILVTGLTLGLATVFWFIADKSNTRGSGDTQVRVSE